MSAHLSMSSCLMANAQLKNNGIITVGLGATELLYTDRHAYTVVEVVSATCIRVQRDHVQRTDKNGMSECQDYAYWLDTDGEIVTLRLTKKGWRSKGRRFSVGSRREYHDYSF